ncbi:hypothetical protein [Pseudomonas syringae]|uniref:Uncharacterized protein n=1 Tax=Pseudomonas syringae pv. syringae TaxID=321 RepID=A0AAE5S750_PSESY|nr:hypothetical protein [Pseudomonas syringae]POQ03672.1 hypothetical protein CXB42_13415 [Pseudomonas syringae pv. syringae]
MSKKPSHQQLVERVAALTVDWYRAQALVRDVRQLLNNEYQQYFAAHGEPEPNFRRINPNDPAYTPVINFTNQTYEQLRKAKQAKGSAKRRMETAVRALMAYRGEVIEAPRAPVVRRANAAGETLQ